jgi:hypothetical protein
MKAAEGLIEAHDRGEETPPIEVVQVTTIAPGEDEKKLSERADRISVIKCEINGDTVPHSFDSSTGTLDLPEHLQGQEVTVTYTSTIRDPNVLQRTYQEIHRQEIERQAREEWNEAWRRSEQDVSPVPQPDPGIVVGETGGGPYRSSKIVKYTPKPEPKLPWYKRVWMWLTRCRTWA